MKSVITGFILIMICASLGILGAPEDKAKTQEKDDSYTLKIDVDLVNINVAVTNASGNYLADLKKANFKIYERRGRPVEAPYSRPRSRMSCPISASPSIISVGNGPSPTRVV